MKNNIVFNRRVIRLILIQLNKGMDYSNNIAREIKANWSGVARNLKLAKESGLIEPVEKKAERKKYPNKLIKYYKLTDKGKKITELLLEIKELIK